MKRGMEGNEMKEENRRWHVHQTHVHMGIYIY